MLKTEMRRSYSAMAVLPTFQERFDYLKLCDGFSHSAFDAERRAKQIFYMSDEWEHVRNEAIIRDDGCDLGIPGREIHGRIYVHHIIPLTSDMLAQDSELAISLDNLVCTSYNTHKAIHYGSDLMLKANEIVERSPNDTCPWKGGRL
jgi:hypothetical protein